MENRKHYIKPTACFDLPESELNTPQEVIILTDKGLILSDQSYDVQNVKTKAIYKNISVNTLMYY